MRGERLELVRGGDEGQAGDPGDPVGNRLVPALPGVEPGAGEVPNPEEDVIDAEVVDDEDEKK